MPGCKRIGRDFVSCAFVAERSAPLLRFIPDVTSGDIARIWSEIADQHTEPPAALAVTFASKLSRRVPSAMGWLPTQSDLGSWSGGMKQAAGLSSHSSLGYNPPVPSAAI